MSRGDKEEKMNEQEGQEIGIKLTCGEYWQIASSLGC